MDCMAATRPRILPRTVIIPRMEERLPTTTTILAATTVIQSKTTMRLLEACWKSIQSSSRPGQKTVGENFILKDNISFHNLSGLTTDLLQVFYT